MNADAAADPVLEALWQKVQQQWDDDAAHERFLSHCLQTQQLPVAAARYRVLQDDDRRPTGLYLERIATLAMGHIDASRTPDRVVRREARKLVAIVLFLGLSIALLLSAARLFG